MTRDDIIRMAREAGFMVDEADFIFPSTNRIGIQLQLERFATIIAEHEAAKWAQGAKVSIPTITMEQEFSFYYRNGYKAGVEAEREACAKLIEGGSFLHDDAPAARLAKEAAKAIRARGKK